MQMLSFLSRYLSSNFVSDLGKYSADQIVAKYGTHVLTNITVGGSYIAYYKSAIIEENTGTEKKQTVSAGAKYNMSKVGLDFDGTWSTTTITEANKKEFRLDMYYSMCRRHYFWYYYNFVS